MVTKKEIRKRILSLRDGLSAKEREIKSNEIFQKLISLPEYKKAKRILCFVTYLSEVQTDAIIMQAFLDGKIVYAPTVCGDDMRFFEILSLEDLKVGYKGILEPVVNSDLEYQLESNEFDNKNDLIIMPGSVFDEACNRIGYGKGFYDRFLAAGFQGKKIAIGFDLQIVSRETFLIDEADIKPDRIITEMRDLKIHEDK